MKKNYSILVIILLLTVSIISIQGGIDLKSANADFRAAEIGLGNSAAQLLDSKGHPQKISYDLEHQIWIYQTKESIKRYTLNQGIVVQIKPS